MTETLERLLSEKDIETFHADGAVRLLQELDRGLFAVYPCEVACTHQVPRLI